MKIDAVIQQRFAELEQKAQYVVATKYADENNLEHVNEAKFFGWASIFSPTDEKTKG